jgi:methionine-rich copper-binding protein CopC
MRKALSTTLLALITVVAYPSNAYAHAGVVATSPSTDQVVTIMPTEISVTFSEELLEITDKEVNTITIATPDGTLLENLKSRVDGPTLIATVPTIESEYPSGLYTVNYRAVSADGHEVTDSYTFSLNAPMLLATESSAQEGENQAGGNGVLPLPILISILTLLVAGGILLIRLRKR